jgi:nitrate reductase gamma subunit
MGAIVSFIAVLILIGVAYLGVAQAGMQSFFGVVIPYAAVATFVIGFVLKVIDWAKSPVPFRIPTTCGQAQSLPWIKQNKLDNPSTTGGVVLRMALEILCFRSLFRNTRLDYRDGPKIRYGSEKFLWLGAIAFHYSFLVVLIWHFRFFMEPVPWLVKFIEATDGFLQVGLPQLLISGVVLLAAAGFLFWRRVYYPQIRYISLASDYFPLFLIMAIAITGILMRYFIKVDIVAVKELTMSLVAFNPSTPAGIGSLFYIHVFLVSILFAYFPFSKLMHMGGVFLSPTRNLPNDSRAKRHVNPWNYPVKTHTYEEYEDDFREQMKEVGLPLDKE